MVMKITKKENALIDEWVELHQEIERLEDELDTLANKLKGINNKLYAKNSKEELEEFRDFLAGEIKKLDKKADKDKIKQVSSLKTIVEHDINIDTLVEQDIDIEEKGIDIDLKDYKK
jgi:predicted nuclease with TOPRIM domain